MRKFRCQDAEEHKNQFDLSACDAFEARSIEDAAEKFASRVWSDWDHPSSMEIRVREEGTKKLVVCDITIDFEPEFCATERVDD